MIKRVSIMALAVLAMFAVALVALNSAQAGVVTSSSGTPVATAEGVLMQGGVLIEQSEGTVGSVVGADTEVADKLSKLDKKFGGWRKWAKIRPHVKKALEHHFGKDSKGRAIQTRTNLRSGNGNKDNGRGHGKDNGGGSGGAPGGNRL